MLQILKSVIDIKHEMNYLLPHNNCDCKYECPFDSKCFTENDE